MRLNWLATTAVALVIGSGAVIAQTQSEQKREEGPRAQQTKDEKAAADRQKNRTAQPEQKGGKEQQRGETNTPAERKQAQEPQHDTKQPTKQTQEQKQDQQKRGETKQSAEPKQQKQENQARDTKQPEQKNQARDTKQPEQKNQARDTKQPTDTKQQQGQQQPSTPPSSNQAAQPSTSPATTPTQQSAQPSSTGQTRQGQTTGQTTDPNRSGTSTSVSTNDPQRAQIVDRLRNDRAARNQNINIQVSIGERLPPRVRARPLPPDIVRIEPRYRGYEYTVVEDQVYIVEPRSKKVVDIIREPSSSVQTQTTYRSDRVVLSTEQREAFKQSARRLSSAPVAGTPSGSSADASCLTLQSVPEEIARNNPELGQYKMLAIGDQVVLVDPRQQKVVEVIE
jgi:hypothetical protein